MNKVNIINVTPTYLKEYIPRLFYNYIPGSVNMKTTPSSLL